jgi:hypothetical protein
VRIMLVRWKQSFNALIISLFSLLLIATSTISVVAQRKNLIVDANFEIGETIKDIFPGREIEDKGSLSLVESPVRSGKRALKVIVDGVRSEIKANGAGGSNIKDNRERWFGFSTYFPDDFETSSQRNSVDIFFQIHERPDACESWRSPPLSLYGQYNKMEIGVIHDPNECSKRNPGNVEGEGNKKTIFSTPFIRGRWVDWVIHVIWSHQEKGGLIEAWMDGKKVVTYTGPNCYNDQKEMYLKVGLYHHDKIKHVHYVDELRMGNANATYEDVAPESKAVPAFKSRPLPKRSAPSDKKSK